MDGRYFQKIVNASFDFLFYSFRCQTFFRMQPCVRELRSRSVPVAFNFHLFFPLHICYNHVVCTCNSISFSEKLVLTKSLE